ncbi:MAG: DUF177 domain-containing protein [Alphaproteobacteria bacterium]|nr:DUF177 domain-containing protein [Alphaproteobacteria bacterium]
MKKSEFYRPISLKDISSKPYSFTADDKECALISKRMGVKVLSFETSGRIYKKEPLRVEGKALAKVEQISVISLEPFTQTIESKVEGLFSKDAKEEEQTCALDMETIEEDFIEPIFNNEIDVGELALQCLALDIPLYPKKEGEVFDEKEEFKKASPFDVLKKLKN